MKTKILNSIIILFMLMGTSYSGKSQQINCPTCIDDSHDDLMTKVSDIDPSVLKGVRNSENGNWFMATGTIHVLIVFAEVDCSSCGPAVCDNPDYHIDAKGLWLNGQFPPNVQDPVTGNDIYNQSYFDRSLTAGQQPTSGNLTDYYYQMSFGQHIVLGDYYPELITVPCTATNKEAAAVSIINNKTLINGAFATKTGLTLSDFDEWAEDGAGVIKTNASNGNIDVIAFVWRNYNTNYTSCDGGYAVWPGQAGIHTIMQDAITSKQTYIGGSWRACNGGTGIFKGEYFHGLFGGNNWHTGNGAGQTNFLTYPQNYSMTSYSMVGKLACAYDRHHMGWYGWKNNVGGTRKDNLISASTATQDEVPTDFEVSTTFPDGNEFILRDFVTYGDAIRIKLPYINWTASGDVKNQYLWIENHQKISSFDQSAWEPSTCKESWSKGIYAYVQVGKDIKESISASILYDEIPVNPNGLGSFLFPLSAEGNYDFKYHFNLAGSSSDNCVWENKYLPIEKGSPETIPNPFTGMSDLFNKVDYNNDGDLQTGDAYQPWTAEVINNQLQFTGYAGGDSKDAFKCDGLCPKKILSLGTNPAPLPVYTYKSNNYVSNSGNTSWENRTIWLNGISVELLGENVDGNGAVKVKVRFDDYEVNNDVRWCGNIKLSPNYQNPNLSNYALNLMPGKTLELDRGKSPTQHRRNNIVDPVNGDNFFTQPTEFTILPNAFFHIESNSTVYVTGQSKMRLESGSKLALEDGANLIIHEGELIIEDGAELILHNGAKLIIENDGVLTINNKTTGKGLLVGDNTVGTSIAEVQVQGTLQFNPTAIWEHYKAGFYNFYSSHTLNLPTSVPITFKGLKTVKFLELESATTLTINGNVVNWSFGLVQYGIGAIVKMNTLTEFHGTSVTFNAQPTSSPTSTGILTDNPKTFITNQCDWFYFDKAIKITNAGSPVLLLASTYKDNTTAIDLDYVNKITIAGSHFSTGLTGINANNSFGIIVSNSEILGITNGVRLNKVSGFYLNNSDINYSATGIVGTDALVFLRTGSKVHNCDNGVELFGSYDYAGANYTTMLTMGDAGCGSVYGNLKGIVGRDFILNIDAEQHAIDRGIPSQVIPNRFDNNSTYTFDICYTDPSVAPSQINAQGNYWGAGNILPNNYRIKASTTCITKPNQGTNIPIISSNYSTCVPVNSCMDCNISPGTSFPGNGGGLSNAAVNVRNAFENANAPFVVEDMVLTRLGFNDLSAVEIIKDTTDSSWTARSVNNEVFALETEGVHRIQVSKAIKAAAVDPNAKMSYLPNDIFAGVTAEEKTVDDFTLYPNPANEIVNIFTNNDELFNYVLVNVLGEEIIKGTFNKTIAIKTRNLSGVYFIEVTNANGRKKIKKLVVNH